MTEESKNEVPNFEATSDGKKIFTPKQWLETFRQYAKRKHKMDITELIRGAEMTQTGWSGKETEKKTSYGELAPKHYTKCPGQNLKSNLTKER